MKRPPQRLFAAAPGRAESEFEGEVSLMFAASLSYLPPANPIRRAAVASLALLSIWIAAPTLAEAANPEPGQLIETKPAKPVPELTLTDLDQEQPASLAAYKGKPLIVNLWATWCGPCIKEMPSLMRLSSYLKDKGIIVVAISEDRGGKFVVDPFVKEHGISGIPIYLDKTMSTLKALKQTAILPMTLLIDAEGQEIGRVLGDREWDSPASKAELEKLFKPGS